MDTIFFSLGIVTMQRCFWYFTHAPDNFKFLMVGSSPKLLYIPSPNSVGRDKIVFGNWHNPTSYVFNCINSTWILQPYNIRVAHKPITTLRHLLTNVKDKDEPKNRQGAVYKIKCSNCQASYIGETGRNLKTRLTEHKRATRNGDVKQSHC